MSKPIETNVTVIEEPTNPPPPRIGEPDRWDVLDSLEVGQSAWFTFRQREDMIHFRNLLGTAVHRRTKSTGKDFTVRTNPNVPENTYEDLEVLAVWRLA